MSGSKVDLRAGSVGDQQVGVVNGAFHVDYPLDEAAGDGRASRSSRVSRVFIGVRSGFDLKGGMLDADGEMLGDAVLKGSQQSR